MAEEVTKKCPFCGEAINAEAIKCRFCKEFLVNQDGTPVSYHDRRIQPPTKTTAVEAEAEPVSSYRPVMRANSDKPRPGTILYAGSPSLWGMAGVFAVAALLIVIGGFLLFFPASLLVRKLNLSEEFLGPIDGIAGLIGVIVIIITLARTAYKVLQLKRIHYEVTPERIEFSRGIFSRKIDNIDLYRIMDIKLHRSLADVLMGVGAVTLVTKDETDPTFEFEKIADPKALYDIIKKVSLQADRRQGVIHVD